MYPKTRWQAHRLGEQPPSASASASASASGGPLATAIAPPSAGANPPKKPRTRPHCDADAPAPDARSPYPPCHRPHCPRHPQQAQPHQHQHQHKGRERGAHRQPARPARFSFDALPYDLIPRIVDCLPLESIQLVRLMGLGSATPELHAQLAAVMRRHVRAVQHIWTKMDTTDLADMFDGVVPEFDLRESGIVLRALQTRHNVYDAVASATATATATATNSTTVTNPTAAAAGAAAAHPAAPSSPPASSTHLSPASPPPSPPSVPALPHTHLHPHPHPHPHPQGQLQAPLPLPPPPPPSPALQPPHHQRGLRPVTLARRSTRRKKRTRAEAMSDSGGHHYYYRSSSSSPSYSSSSPSSSLPALLPPAAAAPPVIPPHQRAWPPSPVAFSRLDFLSARGVDSQMLGAIAANMPRLRRLHVARKVRLNPPRVVLHPSRVLRTVPPEMGLLRAQLTEFAIMNHRISAIPEHVLRLRHLRKLVVDLNDRLEDIPHDIGLRLPRLRSFSAELCGLYTVPQSLLHTLERNFVDGDERTPDYGLFVTGIPKDYLRALIPKDRFPHLHAQVAKKQKW